MPYKLQPADMQEKWAEYRRKCDENVAQVRYRASLVEVPKKIIYSVEGFCLFAGIGEDELEAYESNKNYRVLFKNIRFAVLCRKMDALVNGEGSTTGLVFDLKCNYGLHPQKHGKDVEWNITMNLGDKIVSKSVSHEVNMEEEEEVIESFGHEVNKEEEEEASEASGRVEVIEAVGQEVNKEEEEEVIKLLGQEGSNGEGSSATRSQAGEGVEQGGKITRVEKGEGQIMDVALGTIGVRKRQRKIILPGGAEVFIEELVNAGDEMDVEEVIKPQPREKPIVKAGLGWIN